MSGSDAAGIRTLYKHRHACRHTRGGTCSPTCTLSPTCAQTCTHVLTGVYTPPRMATHTWFTYRHSHGLSHDHTDTHPRTAVWAVPLVGGSAGPATAISYAVDTWPRPRLPLSPAQSQGRPRGPCPQSPTPLLPRSGCLGLGEPTVQGGGLQRPWRLAPRSPKVGCRPEWREVPLAQGLLPRSLQLGAGDGTPTSLWHAHRAEPDRTRDPPGRSPALGRL